MLTPFLRMGRGDAVVDNGGSGGIFADIDLETGTIFTRGFDEKGSVFLLHPDSGICIPGFVIPRWREVVELAERLAASFPECKMTAWDFALTDSGWNLIEVNHNGHLLMQIADGVGVWPRVVDVMKAW